MPSIAPKASRPFQQDIVRRWGWALASIGLHVAWLLTAPDARSRSVREPEAETVWLEAIPSPEPEPERVPEPEPVPEPVPARSPRPRRPRPRPVPRAAPPEPVASGGAPEIADAQGSLTVASGAGGRGVGDGRGEGSASEVAEGPEPRPEPERPARPAVLSLWLDPQALAHRALIHPSTGLLMAVPGYRDVLRGTGIRPFTHLRRLRIRLPGTAAAQLNLAGVHMDGEDALVAATERVAAARGRAPDWRTGAGIAASAWVDGSGVDRGVALQQGAFLIAPRSAMAGLLGTDPGDSRVLGLSRLRERALLLLTLEDAARYLPRVGECGLRALFLSIASASGGGPDRVSLRAEYATASAATAAAPCLAQLPSTPLAPLVDWLAAARGEAGAFKRSFRGAVSADELSQLFTGLAWALRVAGRAPIAARAQPATTLGRR